MTRLWDITKRLRNYCVRVQKSRDLQKEKLRKTDGREESLSVDESVTETLQESRGQSEKADHWDRDKEKQKLTNEYSKDRL